MSTSTPDPAPVAGNALPYQNPTNPTQYAYDFLQFIGAPATKNNVQAITKWGQAESPTGPGYNEFGTSIALPGSSPNPQNPQVQNYASLNQGLEAAVLMIEGGKYTTPSGGTGTQTALAPYLVPDLKAGNVSTKNLAADVLVGNPAAKVTWAGSYQGGVYPPGDVFAQSGSGGTFNASNSGVASLPSSIAYALTHPGQLASGAASTVGSALSPTAWLSPLLNFLGEGLFILLGAGLVIVGLVITFHQEGNVEKAGAVAAA